ncbi:hypothetical protein ZHAS_00021420 [Anopheles sinensis]|uniref:Uncharacterized protein n=1 Tax=Anopheles sinensis TaxID=74873 RepID=A0A084WSD2_ANOSI|nr:hypothetical protein ZHAS_00021420 [Anopheles sinensis]
MKAHKGMQPKRNWPTKRTDPREEEIEEFAWKKPHANGTDGVRKSFKIERNLWQFLHAIHPTMGPFTPRPSAHLRSRVAKINIVCDE